MKKIITLFVFSTMTLILSAQCRVDTVYFSGYLTAEHKYKLLKRTVNHYNSMDTIEETFYQTLDTTGIWQNTQRNLMQYNGNKQMAQTIEQYWKGGSIGWRSEWKGEYNYSNSLKPLQINYFQWDTINNSWIQTYSVINNYTTFDSISSQLTLKHIPILDTGLLVTNSYNGLNQLIGYNRYSNIPSSSSNLMLEYSTENMLYNANGQLISRESSFWDNALNVFRKSNRFEYGYDSYGNIELEKIFRWNTSSSTFDDYSETNTTYDSYGNILLKEERNWDATTSSWFTNRVETRQYFNSSLHLISKISSFNYSVGSSPSGSQSEIFYNSDNKIVKSINSFWDNATSSWLAQYQQIATYYTEFGNNVFTSLNQSFNSASSSWHNTGKYRWVTAPDGFLLIYEYFDWYSTLYDDFTDGGKYEYICARSNVGINDLTANNLNIYPNPTNGSLTISSEKESIAYLSDLQGRAIETLSLSKGENHFEISNLNNGVYFLKIDNNVQRIIKQ